MLRLISLVLLAALNWAPTDTLPDGAPVSVCETMLPFHGGGIPVTTTQPPFRIESTVSTIGQGQTLRVDIQPVPSALTFKGFMVQARNRNPPFEIVGHFVQVPNGPIKYMDCGDVSNSVTHINTNPKQALSMEWQAPPNFLGEVVFNATVAQTYEKFWVGIPSSPVRIVRRDVAPPVIGISTTRFPIGSAPVTVPTFNPTPTEAAVTRDPFYEGCGSRKTCFGFPDGCVPTRNCRSVSSVEVRGDRYIFEAKASYNQPAYVAIGLSTDDQMGDDSVIECVSEGGRVVAYSSWTSPRPNLGVSREGVPQNTIRLVEGSIVGGAIYCRVERDSVTSVQGRTFDLVNNKYYLLVASGSSVNPNGVGYHSLGRLPSASPVNLAEVRELAGASTLLLRLHGAFMIVAWIGTTSLGILLARYFKQTWVGSQLCAKDQWFAWHRICMVTTWSLTMAAFVIIFVELGAWSSERNPHAILGTVTTIICFIQPIGALLRPAPNSKNRPYFNWGHWFGGNLAHILAIVTIFFAVKLTKAELPDWLDYILVAFVAFHVIMHLVFSICRP